MTWEEACQILGVDKKASQEDIKEQYIYKAKLLHPDSDPHRPEKVKKKAEEELKHVTEAYNFLKNPLNSPNNAPKLEISPKHIRFSDVEYGKSKKTSISVKSIGGRYTNIWIDNNPAPWLKVTDVKSSSSEPLPLEITLEASGISGVKNPSSCNLLIRLENEDTNAKDEVRVLIDLLLKTKPTQQTSISEREELNILLHSADYIPEKLIEFFKRNLKEEYEADAGVWQKETVEQHTQKVLWQFEKYFSKETLPGNIDVVFFRTVLALHDIGVGNAISKGVKQGNDIRTAKKMYQAQFNTKYMERELQRLQFSIKEIKIASALVSGDAIGFYLRKNNLEGTVKTIGEMAIDSGLKIESFFELLLIFYMVDAGSYTIDAGGQKGLDYLFVFNHRQKKMYFAQNESYKIDQLWKHFRPK